MGINLGRVCLHFLTREHGACLWEGVKLAPMCWGELSMHGMASTSRNPWEKVGRLLRNVPKGRGWPMHGDMLDRAQWLPMLQGSCETPHHWCFSSSSNSQYPPAPHFTRLMWTRLRAVLKQVQFPPLSTEGGQNLTSVHTNHVPELAPSNLLHGRYPHSCFRSKRRGKRKATGHVLAIP